MGDAAEIEFVFEPQEEGGYHVYAPDLPGLHTQGDTLEDATNNAREALRLYVEGLREEGRTLDTGIIRRKLPLPAWAATCRSSPAPSSSGHWSDSDGRPSASAAATSACGTPSGEHSSSSHCTVS